MKTDTSSSFFRFLNVNDFAFIISIRVTIYCCLRFRFSTASFILTILYGTTILYITILCIYSMSGEKQEDNKTKDYYESESIDNNDKGKSHPQARKNVKDKIIGKIASTITMDESEEDTNLSESIRISNNVRRILLGLFVLIGFIILVFAVFTASVGVELVQVANSVFVAAIVGAFTLVGVIVYQIRGSGKQ
jgi:hypothetical protein